MSIQYFTEPSPEAPEELVAVDDVAMTAHIIEPDQSEWRQVDTLVSMLWDGDGCNTSAERAAEIAKEWGVSLPTG